MDIGVLPADSYRVINKSVITNVDQKILNMLYLPITGALPIILYNMLYDDMLNKDMTPGELEHNHLLNNLHVVTSEFLNARHVLEGIGLLKTYYKKDTVGKYIYELYSPVSAHEFFNHPIFNIVLYNNVGKIEYERLINYFKIPKISHDDYEEITYSFSDVFKMVPGDNMNMYHDNIRKYNKLKLNINSDFDIDLLVMTMPKYIDKKIFTKDIRELIISLSYLYDIDNMKMGEIIKSCLSPRGGISKDELRKVCRDYYQIENSNHLPTVVELTQPTYLRKPIGENTKLARMIYTFETVSPIDFLKSKSNQTAVGSRDIRLLEDLIVKFNLKPGVVNVLIDYILRAYDNKLTRGLVETIASEWARKKIETVEEAMDEAKANYKKTFKNKSNSKEKNKAIKPVWFDKDIEADIALDSEQEEITDLLKEFR